VAVKNPLAKTVKPEAAYEVWQARDWTWYVLKFYQTREATMKNPYGRVFCLVVTPFTGSHGDMGDVYYNEIYKNAKLVHSEVEAYSK
jgi:hypothetical protein